MDWKKWSLQALIGFCVLGLALGAVYLGARSSTSAASPLGPPPKGYQLATFAGGCFWCMEGPFDALEGVITTTSGYTGGQAQNPSYEQVSSGSTGHAEAIRVLFDPKKVSYPKLLDVYWHQINPTTPNRQFVDVGSQYRTAIYYHSEEQKKQALKSKADLEKSHRFGAPIVTEIVPAGPFWQAEEYHQDYYRKHPYKYNFYRWNSGRDQYLEKIWGKVSH